MRTRIVLALAAASLTAGVPPASATTPKDACAKAAGTVACFKALQVATAPLKNNALWLPRAGADKAPPMNAVVVKVARSGIFVADKRVLTLTCTGAAGGKPCPAGKPPRTGDTYRIGVADRHRKHAKSALIAPLLKALEAKKAAMKQAGRSATGTLSLVVDQGMSYQVVSEVA